MRILESVLFFVFRDSIEFLKNKVDGSTPFAKDPSNPYRDFHRGVIEGLKIAVDHIESIRYSDGSIGFNENTFAKTISQDEIVIVIQCLQRRLAMDNGEIPELNQTEKDMVKVGQVIQAIKMFRERFDMGLKDAKDIVDKYRHDLEVEKAKAENGTG